MTDGPQPSGLSGANEGWAVVSTLFAGMVVWGGIGWLIDLWLDTTFVKAIGVLVGMAAAIYLVVVRFGKAQ
jgi:F0F1-type ATP synthase assembly protein I